MSYIQYKYGTNPLETIAEFETRKEALNALREYRLSDPYGVYYISQRACKDWYERD